MTKAKRNENPAGNKTTKAAREMTSQHAQAGADDTQDSDANAASHNGAPVDAQGDAAAEPNVEPNVKEVLNEAAATTSGFDATTGAPPADTSSDQLVTQLQEELAAEKARYADLFDKFQRSTAEFQNSRRRLEKQMDDTIARASVRVILKLLPQLDDLELAFDHLPANLTEDQLAWIEGFRQIQRKLLAVLEEEGVKPMPLTGEFDPNRHEAVSSEPNNEVESGHIIATLRVGYEQNGRVLRPAMVRVAA